MLDEKKVRMLLDNKLQFCPLCAQNTIQKDLHNGTFYCTRCKQIFKKTENLVKEPEIDWSDEFIANTFEGWEVDELKDEIYRLQEILDRNKIKY